MDQGSQGCDCGQQSTSLRQLASSGLVGYATSGTSPDSWISGVRGHGHPVAQAESPRESPRALRRVSSDAVRGSGALQVGADVLEDLAHNRAEEDECHDHDDRDEGQEQTVLDERLAFLILAAEV